MVKDEVAHCTSIVSLARSLRECLASRGLSDSDRVMSRKILE